MFRVKLLCERLPTSREVLSKKDNPKDKVSQIVKEAAFFPCQNVKVEEVISVQIKALKETFFPFFLAIEDFSNLELK